LQDDVIASDLDDHVLERQIGQVARVAPVCGTDKRERVFHAAPIE
jgi:hypothetical protein